MNNQKAVNIDFDVFENDQVFDSISDAQRLVDSDLVVPSDDQIRTSFPTLSVSLPIDKTSANNSSDGYLMVRGYEELVKQNFKNLMLTSPGEKMMDPAFGVGIRRFLFQQEIQANPQQLKGRISSQVKKYLPYVKLRNILFDQSSVENGIQVYISYFINPLNLEAVFNYSAAKRISLEPRGLI